MSDCGPSCNCKCKGEPSRRDLLRLGITVAGAVAGGRRAQGTPGEIPPAGKQPPPKEWFGQLTQRCEAIVYSGDQLSKLIFPLGGIGTGTIWLHGSGRLVNWQIFNNINKSSLVSDTFFAVRIAEEGKPPIIRVLRHDPCGPFKGIHEVRFVGRYPVATMTFDDPELPVEIELEAYNPLVPLDEKSSGIPCAIFNARVRNKTERPLKVSLLASLQNAVGHSGSGAARGNLHATYGGNVNSLVREEGYTAIVMSAQPGKPARIEPAVELLTDHHEIPGIEDSPVSGLLLTSVGVPNNNPSMKTVYWLANGDLRQLGGSVLSQVTTAVRQGGSMLLLSGAENPLLEHVQPNTAAGVTRRETIFATFDGVNFGHWTPEGKLTRPHGGAVSWQSPVSGFLGAGLVNTFDPDDDVQGRLTSPIFTIAEKHISFLIGGGNNPGATCLDLLVGGKVVRSATGKNTERLERGEWDVAEFVDKEAQLQIVDRKGGGWGHVLVDDIRFSNVPVDAITADDAQNWNRLLDDVAAAEPLTASRVGNGRVMVVPLELGRARPGGNKLAQRDHLMKLIADLAGSTYRPATGRPEAAPSFGTMCLATPDAQAGAATAWTDRQALYQLWEQSASLEAAPAKQTQPSEPGRTYNAALCTPVAVEGQGTGSATFVYTWHFPNQYYPQNSWRVVNNSTVAVGNMYANWFHDARTVALQVFTDLENLSKATFAFRAAMFDTTLPQHLVDAVAANVSVARSPTCFWTKDGTFYGFEGCNYEGGGCCPMNCNHVWNYEQSVAHLWPGLGRNMRATELKFHQQESGGCHHRVEVPRTAMPKRHFPVADGQCGAVLKAYREHLRSPDRRFIDEYWPYVKKAMDFAISEWDADADGVMDKPQFNTYDRVIYGANTFVSSLYLAALRAAAEMARLCRDNEIAQRYAELADKGRDKMAATLYEGEYYVQKADNLNLGYGKGCFADQVVGQWWARILDLGDILPVEQVRSALASIYKNNMLWTQEGFQGTQRFLQFADGQDKGLLICTWPKGGRPEDPILYRDEIWTGVEYQVAGHMIFEGQVSNGLAIVKAARERYDGRKRSPWNEIECGDYYVRAMSSWSLLLAAQGAGYDGPTGTLSFRPRIGPDEHRSLFTAASGWGRFEQKRSGRRQENKLTVDGGRCDIRTLRLGLPEGAKSVTAKARLGDHELNIDAKVEAGFAVFEFRGPITVQTGQSVSVELEWS